MRSRPGETVPRVMPMTGIPIAINVLDAECVVQSLHTHSNDIMIHEQVCSGVVLSSPEAGSPCFVSIKAESMTEDLITAYSGSMGSAALFHRILAHIDTESRLWTRWSRPISIEIMQDLLVYPVGLHKLSYAIKR